LFADEVEYWMERFGLTEWGRSVAVVELDREAFASCSADGEARVARFELSGIEPKRNWSDFNIKQAALHEVLELLTYDFWPEKADDPELVSKKTGESHKIIHRLIRVLTGLREEAEGRGGAAIRPVRSNPKPDEVTCEQAFD
jgi:hypothetical protein